MAQTLTNIESNLVFSDEKSKITNENLNNGDIAFCVEDKSITLKYNNNLHSISGGEVTNASTTVKGITKISDAVDSNDNTVAATSKAIKTTYDELSNISTKVDSEYISSQSLIPKVEEIEEMISYKGKVIGVAYTGVSINNYAVLAWIDNNFNEVTRLKKDYFDTHPSYQFTPTRGGGYDTPQFNDIMVKIPLAYWWRGTIPKGPFAGKWGMLLSPTANPGIEGITFKPNYVAFMDKGTLKDAFYYGSNKTRITSNNYICTGASGDPYTVLGINIRKLCSDKGTGWHMATMQEYSEIMARAVVEKKSFKIIPNDDYINSSYYDQYAYSYRGIIELGGKNGSELMDGVALQKNNNYIQVYDNNGNRTWVTTDFYMDDNTRYFHTWKSDQYFDNLFINSEAGGDDFTPDRQDFTRLVLTTGLLQVPNSVGNIDTGVFGFNIAEQSSRNYAFRLAKI